MAPCGLWHKMDKKLVTIPNGGSDLIDEISGTMKVKSALSKHDFGGQSNVRSKSGFSKKKRLAEMVLMFKLSVLRDQSETNVVREDGDRRSPNREMSRMVEKGTEHKWHKIVEPVPQLVLEQV